jgi:energy-coupling factor transporter ATP-binding protein EcfA2
MLLALRGLIPIHGTALDIGGTAILLCGRSGAGKSTFAANLIGLGARLISDDLTALQALPGRGVSLLSGRPGMRLHPGTARWLATRGNVESIEPSHDGKVLVRPARVPPFSEWPLKAIYLLDRQDTALPDPLRGAAFRAQVFRPKLMRKLPGHDARMASLECMARTLGLLRVLDLSGYSQNLALERAERILEHIVASAA